MDNLTKWFCMDIPAGWGQLAVRTVEVALIAFVVMQAKEWFDAGQFDTPGTAADALLIAGGLLLVNAILMLARPSPKHTRQAV